MVWTIKCNLHFHHTCNDWWRLKHLLPQLSRTAGIIIKASIVISDHLKNVKSFCYSYEIHKSWPMGKFQSGLLLDRTNSYFYDWRFFRYSLSGYASGCRTSATLSRWWTASRCCSSLSPLCPLPSKSNPLWHQFFCMPLKSCPHFFCTLHQLISAQLEMGHEYWKQLEETHGLRCGIGRHHLLKLLPGHLQGTPLILTQFAVLNEEYDCLGQQIFQLLSLQ